MKLIINLKTIVIGFLFLFLGWITITCLFYLVMQPLPIVNISTSQGRCVSVEIEGKEYDCSIWQDLDGRYDIVWVE